MALNVLGNTGARPALNPPSIVEFAFAWLRSWHHKFA
jgi:hypothetical protein